jgi:hypothetical protein
MFEASDEKRDQGDRRERDHPMLNMSAENNPISGHPTVKLIAHGELRHERV